VSIAVAGVGRRRSLDRSISINLKKEGRGDQFSGASPKVAGALQIAI
jgi:hypothetical protein